MIKIMLCTLMILGLQTVRAEEPAPPAETVTAAQDTEPASFFEPRTLEDFEQMIKRDTAAVNVEAPGESTNGGAI